MMKYSDKTISEWEALTKRWHTDTTIKCSLQEYLELDDTEYLKFAHGINDKNISDEEVLNKSAEIAKDVVTELMYRDEKVATNIGNVPIEDYREIVAMQNGFDSYDEMYRQVSGLVMDV